MKQTSETSFEPDWLSLREPADHSARDAALLSRAAIIADSGKAILDLGSGTGSTARAFAAAGYPDLPWRFFDNDPGLLKLAKARHPNSETVQGELADIDALPLQGVGLITASALFDLMPEDWLSALCVRAGHAGIPIYTALNYNGDMRWSPVDARDDAVTCAFNRHQKQDKGVGPALGPDAGSTFSRLCLAQGYEVEMAQSPWQLGPAHAALHDALLAGIETAACEAGAPFAQSWGRDRRSAIDDTTVLIGHTDLLVVPQ